jgi:hypothetical protein
MVLWMFLVAAAEAKKPPPVVAPPVGWHHDEGWKGDCYYPPAFDKMVEIDRKQARQAALEAMEAQWKGEKDPDISFDVGVIDNVDTTLLSKPTLIEQASRDNLQRCIAYMKGGPVSAWSDWVFSLPATLTAGDCRKPLIYTRFDYLDIGRAWQGDTILCKGDRAHIWASSADRYRVTDKGDWVNAAGTKEHAGGEEYPCNLEGCNVGTLVARFTGESGAQQVFAIGLDKIFEAPENGVLQYTINDTTWYDNHWFKSSTIEDKTAITIEPAK